MRLPFALIAVLATRLALASGAAAQLTTQPDEDDPPRTVAPPRVEIGGTAGSTIGFPEFGVLASVPIQRNAAIEIVVSRMTAFWDAPPHFLGQVQIRVPFRDHLRSDKSLVVGVTRITAQRGDEGFLGTDARAFVRPHAGVSLQWPTAPTLDFRLDVQGIFTFDREFPLVPRAMAAFVWHRRLGGRS